MKYYKWLLLFPPSSGSVGTYSPRRDSFTFLTDFKINLLHDSAECIITNASTDVCTQGSISVYMYVIKVILHVRKMRCRVYLGERGGGCVCVRRYVSFFFDGCLWCRSTRFVCVHLYVYVCTCV